MDSRVALRGSTLSTASFHYFYYRPYWTHKTDSMELGTGNMDLDSLMAQALTMDVDAVILESHRNWVDNSPVKSFQLSAKYLAQKF